MLHVERLEKVIENRRVLSIESLDVNAGEVVAVVGAVASGKTLLIALLCGRIVPSGGCVTLDKQDVQRTPSARARIGVMFDEDLFYERQSVQSNLEFYCQLLNVPGSRMNEVLSLVELSDHAQKRIEKLSSPVKRRLAFARALLNRPSVLLLDQPTLHTDMETRELFTRLVKRLASEGVAILLTVEDMAWAGTCSTRILELEQGRIVDSYIPLRKDEDVPNTLANEPSTSASSSTSATTVEPERLVPFKIPARKEDRILLYDPADLLYATSREGKTILRTTHEEATTNLTLQELETRLLARGFFKSHRAYLVNLQHIKAVIQYTRNSYTLQLNDEQETMIPLSKQYEKELQALLGY